VKKFLAIILAIVLVLGLAACAESQPQISNRERDNERDRNNTPSENPDREEIINPESGLRPPDIPISPAEDFEYEITYDGVVITSYTGEASEIHIPETIDGAAVTEIGYRAFYRSAVTVVIIPDTVRVIRDYAFEACRSLSVISLPKNLEYIECCCAFLGCSALQMIFLPDRTSFDLEKDDFLEILFDLAIDRGASLVHKGIAYDLDDEESIIDLFGTLFGVDILESFLENAHISSHNSIAATMRNNITYFLQEQLQRNAGYWSHDEMILEIIAISQGRHSVAIISGGTWADWVGDIPRNWDGTQPASWQEALEDYFDILMPDMPKGAVCRIVIANSAAVAAAYWIDGGNPVAWVADDSRQGGQFMDGDTSVSNGKAGERIIGTAPFQ
jgi:hypothetical protein